MENQNKENKENKDEKISGYHQKLIPFLKQKQINVGVIAPQNQGKTEIVFNTLENMIDIKKNKECHIFMFSTTLGSDVNSKRFEDFQKKIKCCLYVYEEIPNKDQNEMREWIMSHVNKDRDINSVIETLKSNKPHFVEEVSVFYANPNQPKIIIVLDDIFIDLIKVQKLMTVCRHINANFLIATHSWINLSPSLKQYIDIFFIRNINPKHYKDIHQNYIQNGMDIKDYQKFINIANDQPYVFFYFATHFENFGLYKIQNGFKQIPASKKANADILLETD